MQYSEKNTTIQIQTMTPPAKKTDPAALLRGLKIPPCPQILNDLNAELRKDDGDPRRIAALVRGDVALSAAVLKIVNSVGASINRSVNSVDDAVLMIGNRNLMNFVVGHFVRQAVSGGKKLNLERFWDRAAHNAEISALLSGHLKGTRRETAYCMGLFHDCGIPLMMQRFPDYKDTLQLANKSLRKFTDIEEEQHGTDHATIGYLMTKSWGLSDVLCDAIRYHHDHELLDGTLDHAPGDEVCVLIGITLISERIAGMLLRKPDEHEWERAAAPVAGFFGLSAVDLDDLIEDVLFQYRQTAAVGQNEP